MSCAVCEISGVKWLPLTDAVILQEVQQMRHLLEIGRHVRIVAAQMDVIERQKDNALDFVTCRLEMAGSLNGSVLVGLRGA